jgi:predicted Zn finger-like uncharacterized protein
MMLTRCPACGTSFRISPDQLKARSGKVRCGQCRSQFNALDTLVDESIVAPIEPLSHPPIAQSDVASPDPAVEETSGSEIAGAAAQKVKPEAAPSAEPESVPDDAPEITVVHADPTEETEAVAEQPVLSESLAAEHADGEPDDELVETAFDDAPKPQRRRWPWAISGILALVALLAQLVFHFRVELAVLQPALKPGLIAVCKSLGCEVLLPRHAEFLGIEASDLHPDPSQKGRLLLAATLRNHAPFAQELPTIELTLNDFADKALIVRDLAPREYLPKEIDVGQGFASNGELAINLTLDVGDVPAAGYRIYLFYP